MLPQSQTPIITNRHRNSYVEIHTCLYLSIYIFICIFIYIYKTRSHRQTLCKNKDHEVKHSNDKFSHIQTVCPYTQRHQSHTITCQFFPRDNLVSEKKKTQQNKNLAGECTVSVTFFFFFIFILMFPCEGRKLLIHLTARDQTLKDAMEFIHRNESTSGKEPGLTQTFCVISIRPHPPSVSQIFLSKISLDIYCLNCTDGVI